MDKPDVVWYCIDDLYQDFEYSSDVSADELDEEELTELILDNLEQEYGERPEDVDVYINDGIGVDTEIEVYIDWAE